MVWRVCCDRCGFKKWNSELREEWTGLMVCRSTCWEARHPQDFVKGKLDKQSTPWARPEPAEIDVSPGSGNEVSASDL